MLVNSLSLLFSLCCVALLPAIPSARVLLLSVPLLIVLFTFYRTAGFYRAAGLYRAADLYRTAGLHRKPALFQNPGLHQKSAITFVPLAIFIAGFVYGCLTASAYLSRRLPTELLGVEVEIVATIVDLPNRDGRRLRFLAELESIKPLHSSASKQTTGRLRLTWYGQDAPDLRAGNKVRLVVKLKAPSGFMNPGGFDIEKWFAQNRIVATGYVRTKSFDVEQSVIAQSSTPLSTARNHLQRRLLLASEAYQSSGVIAALAVGDRSGIDRELWDTFISTGTNHLLAISGLHISLVAGAFAMLVQVLWRYNVFCKSIFGSIFRSIFRFKTRSGIGPIAQLGTRRGCSLVVALCAAFCYAAMAGFSVPTVRALMMFSVLVCLLLLRRHQSRLHSLVVALLVVCLLDPLSVMSPGFWMSFAAVAVLLLVFSNSQGKSISALLLQLLRGHILITIGLYPLTVMFFGQASLVSPLANLFVTPLVGMLVTPLVFIAALLTAVSVPLASYVLLVVDYLLRFSFKLLEFMSALPFAMVKISGFSSMALCLAALASLLMLVPLSRSVRAISIVLVLPLVLPVPVKRLDAGEYSVSFLDVGQGTSVVVQTANHVLVYDTGDQFSSGFSAANAVVLPYLRSKSLHKINKLIVSHADRDHSGGADELLDELHIEELMLTEKLPQRPEAPSQQCVAGDRWNWDGVEFKVLHPQQGSTDSGNNLSCVLLIEAIGTRTLLTGDIEAAAETRLLSLGVLPPVDVLMSPHHGSTSSSGKDFVAVLNPKIVVHSAGYKNRFNFPRPEIVDTYRAIGATQFSTAQSGMLEIQISKVPDNTEAKDGAKEVAGDLAEVVVAGVTGKDVAKNVAKRASSDVATQQAVVEVSEYRVKAKRWWHRLPVTL